MSGMDDLLPPYDLALNYFTLGGEKSPGKCEIRGAAREWQWNELAGYGLDGANLSLVRRQLVEFEIDVRITTQTDLDAWSDFYAKVLQNPYSKGPTTTKTVGPYDAAQKAKAQARQSIQIAKAAAANPAIPQQQLVQLEAKAQSDSDVAATLASQSSKSSTEESRGLGIYHPRLASIGITSVVILRVSQPVQGKGGSETFTIKMKEYRSPKFVAAKTSGTVSAAAQKQPTAKTANQVAIQEETAKAKRLSAADEQLGTFNSLLGGS